MNLVRKHWHILVLCALALTPIIWFWDKGDVLINGLDTNFPLDPLVWFRRRFFVWNDTINAGIDASSSLAGFFFHLVQVVPYVLGFGLKATEIISMLFWFGAIVSASYYFIGSLIKDSKFAKLLFTLIYSYNIYLYNTWENVKVSNLALVVGLPLFVGLLIRRNKEEITTKQYLTLAGVFSIVSSGTGINPAYLIALLGALFIYTLIEMLLCLKGYKKIIYNFSFTVLIIGLANSFWILPLIRFLFISKGVSGLEDIGYTNWIDSLSENTSLLNVLRLQGAWDWYAVDGAGFPSYIPYALNYFKSLPFILFSFALPALALLSLSLRSKQHKSIYVVLGVLVVIGVFMGAGLHTPTGSFYNILLKHVPFFSFFRSPWYIFTPYVVFGYAGLVALLYNTLDLALVKRKFHIIGGRSLLVITGVIFVFGHLLYSYPLISGKIFRPGRSDSFYVSFPNYVFEAGTWLDENDSNTRIISYPDDQLETFDWGYRGTESLLSLYSKKETIAPSFAFEGRALGDMLDVFYQHAKRGETNSAFEMIPYFNADAVLVKHDSVTHSPPFVVEEGSNINKKDFGKWSVYKRSDISTKKIYASKGYYTNYSNDLTLARVMKVLDKEQAVINVGDTIATSIPSYSENDAHILKAEKFSTSITANSFTYRFTVEKSGNYTVLLDKRGVDLRNIEIMSSSIPISRDSFTETDSAFVARSTKLDTGVHEFIVTYPIQENVAKIHNLDTLYARPNLRDEELPESEDTIVLFNEGEESKLLKLSLPNIDPFSTYLFTLDYNYIYGDTLSVDALQYSSSTPLRLFPMHLSSDPDWQTSSIELDLVPLSSNVDLQFRLSGSDSGEKSKSYVENINVVKIYDNEMYLLGEDAQEFATPEIHFTKISPVEYTVEATGVTENYTLVFLENYSSDWTINSDDDIGTPLHFTANGYANGWYIPGNSENQKITIYYKAQDNYKVGSFISSLTLLVLLSSHLWYHYYEKQYLS